MNAPREEAEAHAKVSVKENRVYIGNLTYATTYRDLWDFMQEGGFLVRAARWLVERGEVSDAWEGRWLGLGRLRTSLRPQAPRDSDCHGHRSAGALVWAG